MTRTLARGAVLFLLAIVGCRTAATPGREIEVVASDYAFQAPDTVDAGPTLVHLRNVGKVRHEMILVQLEQGATAAQLLDAQRRDETVRPFVDGGNAVLFAAPGRRNGASLEVNFEAGRDYLLVCNFADGEGKPLHFTLGMFKPIHVRGDGGALAAADTTAQDVIVDAMDYAFRVPDTLPAGPTSFRMRNLGKVRHEVAVGLLAPGATVRQFLEKLKKGEDVDPLFEGSDALLTARAGEENELALYFDLLPGRRYLVACEFRDGPDAPPHLELGMFKELVVR
jgi:hypothetical protein